MAERLQQNVFSGVIPSSYIFIDDGSDSSKWLNNSARPWAVKTEGDSSGYFGKGMHLEPGIVQAWAGRWYPLRNLDRLYFGIIYRWSGTLMPAAFGTYHLDIYLRNPRWLNALGTSVEERQLIIRVDQKGASAVYPQQEQIQFIGTTTYTETIDHDGGIFSAGGNVNPIRYWNHITGVIENSELTVVTVNRVKRSVSIALPAGPDTEYSAGQCYLVSPHAGTGVAGQVGWDIDQIWVSDTENIV